MLHRAAACAPRCRPPSAAMHPSSVCLRRHAPPMGRRVPSARYLHTPIEKFPNVAVVSISKNPIFSAKFALPGQGKDHWDKAEIDVHGPFQLDDIVPRWMHFLHGEVQVFPNVIFPPKAEQIKSELDQKFQCKLLELQTWSPGVYEQFWSENGEHLLQAAKDSAQIVWPLLLLRDEIGKYHSYWDLVHMPPDQLPRLVGNGVELNLRPAKELIDKQQKFIQQLTAATMADRNSLRTTSARAHRRIAFFVLLLLLAVLVWYLYHFHEDKPKKTRGATAAPIVITSTQDARRVVAHTPEPRSVTSAVAGIGDLVRAISGK